MWGKQASSLMKTYYVRLNITQIQALRRESARLWQLTSDPAFDGAALIAAGNHLEQLSSALSCMIDAGSNAPSGPPPDSACDLPIELLLTAIDGRTEEEYRDEAIDFGHGGAYVLSPVTVRTLSAMLKSISGESLRHALTNRAASANTAPRPEDDPAWIDPAQSALASLQRFYINAAAFGQYVLVVSA